MAKVDNLGGFIMGLGTAGMVAGFSVYVIYKTKVQLATTGNVTTNPRGYDVNVTFDNAVTGLKDSTSWFPIIVVVAMGMLAIGYFSTR